MTTKNTLFQFQNKPISLEDLEALYANGSVTPDDTISITERTRPVTYEISFLIYLYGEEHPFRRIPRPEISKNVGGAFGELGNFTEISIPFEKIPLLSSYHGINRKKLEVEDIQILKNLFQKVCKARELLAEDLFFHRVFDFCLQRQVKDCKVCNHAISPKHLLKIIQHIFSEEHLSKLKGISNREINFWINIFHLGSMIRKRRIENWQQILTLKNLSTRVPLVDFDIQSELVPAALRESRISTLDQIFKSLNSKIWSTKIPPIFKLPDTVVCVACSKLPNIFQLSNVEITAHLFSESHLFYLIQFGYTQKDYDWWEQYLRNVAESTVIQEEDSIVENNQIHVEEVPESSETTVMQVESIEPPATLSESLAPTAMPKVITASGTSEWLFQDYPLFHPNNQPDNDLITGQEVIDEIEKLKKMINLDPMPEEYKEYFFFVNGRFPKMGLRNRAAACRFCGNIPLSPMAFFHHLFDEDHVRNLCKFQISKSSFDFWTNHLDHCRRIAEFRKPHEKTYLPLFDGNIWDSDKRRLEKQEIQSLVESFSKISEDDFINEKVYVSVIFRNPKFPGYCKACNIPMPLRVYHYAKHLFSEKHLSNIREIPQKDIDFWMHAFRIPAFEFMDPSLDETIIYKPIFDAIPLLETYGGPVKLEESVIEQLVKLSENLKAGSGNEYLSNFYELVAIPRRCNTCDIEFPKLFNIRRNIFPVTKHILSERHLKTLSGVPQAHINFWINFLNLEVNAKKIRPADKVRILSRKNTCPIPLIDFKLESDFMEQNERLPKIDWLYGIFEKIKEDELKNEPIKLGNTGKELVAQEVICYACERAKGSFENNFQLVTHIFSRRHVNYLFKFGFSEKAFIWWKNTLESFVDPEDLKILENPGPPVEEKPPSIENEQKMSEILENRNNRDILEGSDSDSLLSESESELDDDDTENDKKQVEATGGIKANNPRMPLLDKPEDGVEMSHFTRNPLRILGARMKENCTELQILRAQSMIVDEFRCTFCDENFQAFKLGNKLFMFWHIATRGHWEKMNFMAPTSELQYWETWANCIIEDRIVENIPKVPMLDRPESQPNQVIISKEQMDQVLGELGETRKKINIISYDKNAVFWTCSYCSDLKSFKYFATKLEAWYHIASDEHKEKMGNMCTETELEYWKEWIRNTEIESMKYEKRQYDICSRLHGDIYDRQRNSPRVPLIDLPQPYNLKMLRHRFKLEHNRDRELLSILKPCEITEEPVEITCYHCPGTPKFTTVWDTMQHAFDEIHAQNINYIGLSEDLFHYKLLLKRVLVKQPLPEPYEHTPIPKPKPMELCYKLEMCILPLFHSPLFRETGKYCRGPTNRQILFIQSLRVREDVKFFEKPMKCLPCQLDMSNFSILDVARHAFSIRHLEKVLFFSNVFYIEEFDWWMEKLKTSSDLKSSEPSESSEYYLGGLKSITTNRYIPVFEKFTDEELKLISNVDEQKVRENEEILLRRFGGCIYCDLWIPATTDIFPHFFSEQHFEKVREHHPVKQIDVDDVMHFVKLCQNPDC